MANIAFPAMAVAFQVPPESIRWVIVCYVLTYSFVSFVGGSLGDRLGHARVFRVGLAATATAFALVAAAPTFGWLLTARMAQGIGAGLVYGTAPGLTTLVASASTRGRALGFLNAAIGLSGTIGPVAAGALVHAFGWPAVFVVRVPIALVVLLWAWQGFPPAPAISTSPRVAADLFQRRVVRACVLSFVANGAIFSIWLLTPFYLVDLRGLDAFVGGVMFMLTPLGTAAAAPLAGRFIDRFGSTLPLTLGLGLEAVGLLALSRAGMSTPLVVVALSLFAAGFGLGLFQVPNMTTVMNAFSAARQGAAGGLAFMARTLGVVTGVTTLSMVFGASRRSIGVEGAYVAAFVVAAVVVALAAIVSTIPERHRGQSDRPS
jgi:MFS family permease